MAEDPNLARRRNPAPTGSVTHAGHIPGGMAGVGDLATAAAAVATPPVPHPVMGIDSDADADATHPAAGEAAGAERVPPSVLVAEDEPVTAHAIKRGLEFHGFRVVGPVHSGEDALKLAESARPDIALLDINMFGMDGLSAADQLQSRLGVPAVILSAHTDAEYFERAKRVGVSGYLVKPVKPEELAVAIDLALTRFRQLQTLAERVAALEQNLNDRKVIERAKGVLMRSKGISEEEAYLRIQRLSRKTHRRMVDVAKSVLDAQDLL
jgi:response regulator NasT